jgi:N utilization substance protein B
MKLLYQVLAGGRTFEEACANFEELAAAPDRSREYALEAAQGVMRHRERLDAAIAGSLSPEWTFDRIAAVELQLIRIAAWELLEREDIPARVTIDEAIELAREYATAESTKFVNGVLDALAAKHAAHKLGGR